MNTRKQYFGLGTQVPKSVYEEVITTELGTDTVYAQLESLNNMVQDDQIEEQNTSYKYEQEHEQHKPDQLELPTINKQH